MPSLYFEQQFGMLCGQHCLNNLLQGPYYTAVDLAEIGRELDAIERRHMMAMGSETADALRFLAEDSGNVDDDGNFSVQVLREALERSHSLQMPSAEQDDVAGSDPTAERAIVCNLAQHWFALRKLDGQWWSLNSMNKAPEMISDFYLSAFLQQLKLDGYSLFYVRGELPEPMLPVTSPTAAGSSVEGRWFDVAELGGNSGGESGGGHSWGQGQQLRGVGGADADAVAGEDEDAMLARALQESAAEFNAAAAAAAAAPAPVAAPVAAAAAAPAPAPSADARRAAALAAAERRRAASVEREQEEEDAELQRALQMSMGAR